MLAPGRAVPDSAEWRVVTATGTYAPEDTVVVRYRTREGSSGVDVVVPLETAGGPPCSSTAAGWPRATGAPTPPTCRRPRPAR